MFHVSIQKQLNIRASRDNQFKDLRQHLIKPIQNMTRKTRDDFALDRDAAMFFHLTTPHPSKNLRQITHIDSADPLTAQWRIRERSTIRRHIRTRTVADPPSKTNARCTDDVTLTTKKRPSNHQLRTGPRIDLDQSIRRTGNVSESPRVDSKIVAREA